MTAPATRTIIVGAGPVGLTAALCLARHGLPSLVLEAKPGISEEGSRAIVVQRPTLEAFEQAAPGVERALVKLGTTWTIKRTYYRGRLMFSEEYPSALGGELPTFVNVGQPQVEAHLLHAAQTLYRHLIEFRFDTPVSGVRQTPEAVFVATPAGEQAGSFVLGCDGGRSIVRTSLGIGLQGSTSGNYFLIADIKADLPFPNERRFHYDAPSHPGQQILVMPHSRDTWRIDWSLSREADVDAEKSSGRIRQRIEALVGRVDYDLTWLSAYRFNNLRADTFRCGRALLAGDAAHLFSPFGGRGMNSGIADAREAARLLAGVLKQGAALTTLDEYCRQREAVADANLAVTTRTLARIAPSTSLQRWLRNAALRASPYSATLRRFVDSGPYSQTLGAAAR
jgi:2-polyprenyl-6-methoxyphenol hydroxylase-like FAD-dependent oxidoreductase